MEFSLRTPPQILQLLKAFCTDFYSQSGSYQTFNASIGIVTYVRLQQDENKLTHVQLGTKHVHIHMCMRAHLCKSSDVKTPSKTHSQTYIWQVSSQNWLYLFLSIWDICDWRCWNIKKIIRKFAILLIFRYNELGNIRMALFCIIRWCPYFNNV